MRFKSLQILPKTRVSLLKFNDRNGASSALVSMAHSVSQLSDSSDDALDLKGRALRALASSQGNKSQRHDFQNQDFRNDDRSLPQSSSQLPLIDLDLSLSDLELPLSSPKANYETNHSSIPDIDAADPKALRQILESALAEHGVGIVELEYLGNRLQLSLSSSAVPDQEILVPFIQEHFIQIEVGHQIQKVEIYGHQEGCELPFWRSEFNPADLELAMPRQRPAKIKPVKFAFSAQSEIDAPDLRPSSQESSSAKAGHSSSGATALAPDISSSHSGLDGHHADALSSAQPTDRAQETETSALPDDAQLADAVKSVQPSDQTEQRQVVEADTLAKRKFVDRFLARYAAGEREFAEIDLSETDLSGINLTLADLQSALLVWTNLQEASLYHVNLLGAKLRHANLKNAKLRSANLRGADFLNADLSGADLSWSNLTGANLTGANLTDANLKSAVLDNVIMPDGTRLD